MRSFEKLVAGALVAGIMALPAYAQTQTMQPQTTQQRTKPPQSTTQTPTTQPQARVPQPDTATNAEIAVDAISEPKTDEEDVTIEDSAILPSAEGHAASRAPSMELDCKENPKDCLEPLTTDSPGPTLSTTPRQ